MAELNKVNKTFATGEKLKSADMNKLVSAINALVEEVKALKEVIEEVTVKE